MENKATHGLRFGAFEFDAKAGELRKGGRKVKLQGQPIQILGLLLEEPGEVITREELQKKLWPSDTFVDFEHSLNAAIKRLRDALDDSASTPRYVETLARRGYRWVGPLPEVDAALNTSKVEADPSSASGEQTTVAKGGGSAHPIVLTRRRVMSLMAVLVLLSAVVAAWTMWRSGTAASRVPDSIAVLPFVNGNHDQSAEYLTDGITEQVINALSQFPHVRILARTTVFHYKNSDEDPRKIGRDLGVSAVLTGRLTQNGQEVLVQADLVSVKDGSELWGEQYERRAKDLFVVQRDIATDIAGKLRIQLNPAQKDRLDKLATGDQEAYLLYLKGRYFWNQRTPEGFRKAIDYFTQATEHDPKYAAAYSGLGDTYRLLANYQILRPEEAHRRALPVAIQALACDPTSAEAHTTMAGLKGAYEWDWQGAEKEFQEAIELNPNYATARHWYSAMLWSQHRFEQAKREAELAIQLDPLSAAITSNLGDLYYVSGHFDEAIEQYKKALELNPNLAPLHGLLSRPYFLRGMYAEWLASYQRSLVLFGDKSDIETAAALTRVGAGHVREALAIMIRHAVERHQQGHEGAANVAILYLQYGDKESAYMWLDRAADEHAGPESVLIGPLCVSLRSEARFQNLLRRVNLPVNLTSK